MDPALTPDLALAYLRELSADVRAGVVLDARRSRLSGPPKLAAVAAELSAVCLEAVELELEIGAGRAFAARSAQHFVLVATGPFALAGLVRHDLRAVLAGLVADAADAATAGGRAAHAPAAPPRSPAVGAGVGAPAHERSVPPGRRALWLRLPTGQERFLDASEAPTAALRGLAARLELAAQEAG